MFFNSHPHKEDDTIIILFWRIDNFSTHILTRRMTVGSDSSIGFFSFSTHILTRRMTFSYLLTIIVFIFSTHILTRRMTVWCRPYGMFVSFSTHILTRRMTCLHPVYTNNHQFFNSHPHKEDDATSVSMACHIVTFQLTSSQGG